MLQVALDKLAQSLINKDAQRAIANTLKAASNPHSESIDVIIKSLPKAQRKMIEKTARGLRAISADVQARGRKRLLDMSDDEWNNLIERAD